MKYLQMGALIATIVVAIILLAEFMNKGKKKPCSCSGAGTSHTGGTSIDYTANTGGSHGSDTTTPTYGTGPMA